METLCDMAYQNYCKNCHFERTVFTSRDPAPLTKFVKLLCLISDLIDPVKDPYPSSYYKADEDPKKFISKATKRGPLAEDWLDEYVKDPKKQPIMCAYKLIKVEFKYWGIQVRFRHHVHTIPRQSENCEKCDGKASRSNEDSNFFAASF